MKSETLITLANMSTRRLTVDELWKKADKLVIGRPNGIVHFE